MNNVGVLHEILSKPISDKNIEKILTEVGEKVRDDIRALAPIDTGEYQSSINLSETVHNGNKHTIKIYTDLNSGWNNVPLGCLLEWGTGTNGELSNTYEHGYPYRQTPWVYFNERYNRWVFTHGNVAHPHFIPGLYSNIYTFEQSILKGVTKYGK